MAGLRVYRALSRVFPRSFRAKLMAVVLGCTLLPMLVFVAWLLAHNGADPGRLLTATSIAIAVTLLGTLVSLLLIYQLLQPLRMVADVIETYYREHRLPALPEDGCDEIGLLMHGVNRGLREIEAGRLEMERLSLEDPLTHAMNRRGSERSLLRCVERAEHESSPLVLYVVDLDNLKVVNDEFGHAAGDQMLITLVDAARRSLGDDANIGRWGGDEFLVCLHDPLPLANDKVRNWLHALRAPIENGILVSVSIGCAEFRPGVDAMQLYHEADAAMYRAKADGGSKLVCHGSERELLHR
jgi:diguanylate cyclase (GGDEF)-like protein